MTKNFILLVTLLFLIINSCSSNEDECTTTPELITNQVTNISDTTALLSGKIEPPSCDPTVTSQGFVFSESILPKITDNVIEVNGVDITKQINNLKQNKTYYYRTFFTNPLGTFYGNEVTFTTQVGSVILNATSISNITAVSSIAHSSILSAGEGQITERGVCWSTNQNPTTANNKKEDGGVGTGEFNSELQNLNVDTTYYLRTYAINEAGTTYGEEINFKTRDGVIILTTEPILNITIDSALSGGNITDDGGSQVTMRGVCWSINQEPTTADNKTEDGNGIGQFSSELTNLDSDSTYYLRAYATNTLGTHYGETLSFVTVENCNNFITEVVEITNPVTGKIWMDRNLGDEDTVFLPGKNYSPSSLYQWGRGNDGHQCRDSKTINTQSTTDNPGHGDFIFVHISSPEWQIPQNDNLWQGVNGINNPCPSGFRLPTEAEIVEEMQTWRGGHDGLNSPVKWIATGSRGGSSIAHNGRGYYWTSTVSGNSSLAFQASRGSTTNYGPQVFTEHRSRGFAVRCIKD